MTNDNFTDRRQLIDPAVKRWDEFFQSMEGNIVPFMVKVRTESMSVCESFCNHCRRVLYSPTASLRRAFEEALGDAEYSNLVYDLLPSFRQKTILGQWGMQRVVVPLTENDLQKIVSNESWKTLSTDALIEAFSPWAIYVCLPGFVDPTGMDRKLTGAYIGFEYHHDEVRLFCQMVGEDLFEPVDYQEFRLPQGVALGEALEVWEYDMPYRTLLCETLSQQGKVSFGDFMSMKQRYAQTVGRIAFAVSSALFAEGNPDIRIFESDNGTLKKFEEDGNPLAREDVNLDFRKVDYHIRQPDFVVALPESAV